MRTAWLARRSMEFARVVTLKERVSSCAGGCMLPSMAPESGFIIRFPFRIVYLADDGIHRYHQFGAGEIPGTYILAYGSTADYDNIHIRVEAVNHHFGGGGSLAAGKYVESIQV